MESNENTKKDETNRTESFAHKILCLGAQKMMDEMMENRREYDKRYPKPEEK